MDFSRSFSGILSPRAASDASAFAPLRSLSSCRASGNAALTSSILHAHKEAGLDQPRAHTSHLRQGRQSGSPPNGRSCGPSFTSSPESARKRSCKDSEASTREALRPWAAPWTSQLPFSQKSIPVYQGSRSLLAADRLAAARITSRDEHAKPARLQPSTLPAGCSWVTCQRLRIHTPTLYMLQMNEIGRGWRPLPEGTDACCAPSH